MPTITLTEWSEVTPEPGSVLYGRSFDGNIAVRSMAEQLIETGQLAVTELRQGLLVRSTSYVGTVHFGDLQIVVKPKLDFDVLKVLFRYAYGLHQLYLYDHFIQASDHTTFQDLLIQQVAAESERLLQRGLHRQYQRTQASLVMPCGRIDFQQIARNGGVVEAQLPCTYYTRSEANVLNLTMQAGLLFAAKLTDNLSLRTHLRRLASRIAPSTAPGTLSAQRIQDAYRALNRLTSAYEPAIKLVALLYQGTGLSFTPAHQIETPLPGFLFDMNHFFETLVTRFLRENLPGYDVQAQYHLRAMFTYAPAYNPLRRQSPTPRPDLALLYANQVVALLDTKYRDLWTHSLPRDMLYQLAIYALSQSTARRAMILYPVTTPHASRQEIEIRDPIHSQQCANILVQPIHLPTLADFIANTGATTARERAQYVQKLLQAVLL